MTRLSIVVFAGLAASMLAAAGAQQPPLSSRPQAPGVPPPWAVGGKPIDAATRKAAVEQGAQALRDKYIDAKLGAHAADLIEQRFAAGAYDRLEDDRHFQQALQEDLFEITGDGQIRVGIFAPPGTTDWVPHAVPPRLPSQGGVVRADRLAGGFGYLRLDGMSVAFEQTLDKVMAQLADRDALVIDVRHCGGGSRLGIVYLASYFLDTAKPVKLNTIVAREEGKTELTTTEQMSVATPKPYLGKQVRVLVGRGTSGGCEEFAYDMQALKLATIVGERTSGFSGEIGGADIGGKFKLVIPNQWVRNAVTGKSWVGAGIQPDLSAGEDDALKVALESMGPKVLGRSLDSLTQAKLFTPRTKEHPASAASVRRIVQEIANGEPNYDLLSPPMAKATRERLESYRKDLGPLGVMQSATFREVDSQGMDVFDVKFEKGAAIWRIYISDDGKTTAASNFKVMP